MHNIASLNPLKQKNYLSFSADESYNVSGRSQELICFSTYSNLSFFNVLHTYCIHFLSYIFVVYVAWELGAL